MNTQALYLQKPPDSAASTFTRYGSYFVIFVPRALCNYFLNLPGTKGHSQYHSFFPYLHPIKLVPHANLYPTLVTSASYDLAPLCGILPASVFIVFRGTNFCLQATIGFLYIVIAFSDRRGRISYVGIVGLCYLLLRQFTSYLLPTNSLSVEKNAMPAHIQQVLALTSRTH